MNKNESVPSEKKSTHWAVVVHVNGFGLLAGWHGPQFICICVKLHNIKKVKTSSFNFSQFKETKASFLLAERLWGHNKKGKKHWSYVEWLKTLTAITSMAIIYGWKIVQPNKITNILIENQSVCSFCRHCYFIIFK